MPLTSPLLSASPTRSSGERLRHPFAVFREFIDSVAASSPARLALIVFVVVIFIFTGLLALPISSASGHTTPFHDALFTAVSAVCVTGLTTVSTALHWSFFGQLVILIGIYVGGLGILTLASLMALMVSRRLGVRGKLIAQGAVNASRLGEVGTLLRTVITTSTVIELVLAAILFPRLILLGEPPNQAAWHAIFYAISAFNNAGFTPHSNGLVPYQADPWILLPLMAGVFLGSLGFPVLMVLRRYTFRARRWNLHTKLTVHMCVLLLAIGTLGFALFEWNNPHTIQGQSVPEKLLQALFASTMARSGGFNLVDISHISPVTQLLTDALMFTGGGSASTAGGIKVTTLAVMLLAIVAEARGDRDMSIYGRRIPEGTMRVAISVFVLGTFFVFTATALIVTISPAPLGSVLFEVISAFATCGLSTGLSSQLPPAGVYVLSVLMFAGRVGTITVASALAVRQRRQLFHYPDERPILG